MPVCQNCHNKWSWKQTFKRSFTSTLDGMTCPYCEEKQYLTSRVRKGSTIIPFIIITLIMLSNLFFGPSFVFFFALLGLIPLFFGIYPFFVELSNKEEALW
ncbi:TIGR04104 family putative zinc finger protein [Virgibacillus sp. CBA3643]|uniref:TIGR04104 family putative zinc finger protein n=1 Tax=Virgibacillus sp. CBA3643 TaxID=2942278 RepID=UPI0035A26253